MTTISEGFRKASDVMSERGKGSGTALDAQGRVCAYGAVGIACGMEVELRADLGFWWWKEAIVSDHILYNQLSAKLESHIATNTEFSSVPAWSDNSPEAEVIATLRDLSKEE